MYQNQQEIRAVERDIVTPLEPLGHFEDLLSMRVDDPYDSWYDLQSVGYPQQRPQVEEAHRGDTTRVLTAEDDVDMTVNRADHAQLEA